MQKPPEPKPNPFWLALFIFFASIFATIGAVFVLTSVYRLVSLMFGRYSSYSCTYVSNGQQLTTPICEEKEGRMTLARVFPSEAIVFTAIGFVLLVILGFIVFRLYKRCFKYRF
jgi:hypothetical protein